MAPIVLDQLDGGLLERLSDLAKIRNVSLEDQIISVLNDALRNRIDERIVRADAIAAMTPKGVKQTDSTLLVREDRDL